MGFKQQCSQYFTSNSDEATHLFMDGGKLHIPLESLISFYNLYISCINNNEKISLVEKLGKNIQMRFFLDVDFKNCLEDIHIFPQLLNKCNEIVGINGTVFECSQYKGFHIIYNIPVSHSEAITLASKINKFFPKYIDLSVYSTGLRMLGSIKYEKNHLVDRFYGVKPLDFDTFRFSIVRIKKLDYIPTVLNTKPISSNLHKVFQKISDRYTSINITKISFNSKFNSFTINTDCKFCTNKNDFHKNNNIYFVIDKNKYLYQKCMCRCIDTNRVFNYCGNFVSKGVKVPNSVYNELLPTQ